MTVLEVVTELEHLADIAQTSGLVPGGEPALVLAGIVAGLHIALQSGMLTPGTIIEIDEIGTDFAAALERMQAARVRGR